MFHFLVYCVKLLTYCLPTLAYARLLPLASGCLHTCSLPKPRTSTVVALPCCKTPAAARCAVHLLSTDVYAKCHILYLSCLNCSSLFYVYFYTIAAAAAPLSLPAADPPLLLNLTSFHKFFLLNFSSCTQDGAIYT